MQVSLECVPCYLRQVLNAMQHGEIPVEEQGKILDQILLEIPQLDKTATPALNSSLLLHRLQEMAGVGDLFQEAKEKSNEQALALLPLLREMVSEADWPLELAVKLAVAGNIVDLGILQDYDLEASIRQVLHEPFTIYHLPALAQDLRTARKVLIIGDNSGEIIFDSLLVEQLLALDLEVTYSVKAGPILNDATREDAEAAGLPRLCRVIDTGNNFLGVVPEHSGQEFLQAMAEADVVISKGQANYESLEGTELAGEKTYFLLKAKCPLVAAHLGVELGDLVLKKNDLRR
ncbi:DUF89 domain-containing protein [Carboxydocella sp. JDF658]|uniref:damage-control phosphatase ARMT1 family protein n=1 Tax=Carboxydocella sp. JDF658 TaxID=1926600 RepID=UPI0009ADE0B0|nr:ARMT1-like domain-containing protein [Carboxydocella sp. JDF658]GAW32942.1 hypothetical protein JDF658_27070 [Carboxydocella sp. JDF658]